MRNFRWILAVVCTVLVFSIVLVPSACADWSMYRSDPLNSGVGTGNAVVNPVLLWNYSAGGEAGSPVVVAGILYVGSDDGNIYALNASTGAKIWNCSTGNRIGFYMAVENGVLYASSHSSYPIPQRWPQSPAIIYGYIDAFNATNGRKLWNYTTNDMVSPPVVANGKIYFLSEGCIYALSTISGHVLWRNTVGGIFSSAPAVVDGVVYAEGIDAFNAETGKNMWVSPWKVYSSPTVADGTVFARDFRGEIGAFNVINGHRRWNYTLDSEVWCVPVVFNGSVYFGSYDGTFYALNATNGRQLWNYTLGHDSVISSPAIAGGIVYVSYSDHSGNLYAFNTTTGSLLWNYNMTSLYGSGHLSDPVVDGGVIYLSCGNSVYALGESSMSPEPTASANVPVSSPDLLLIVATVALVSIAIFIAVLVMKRKNKYSPKNNIPQ